MCIMVSLLGDTTPLSSLLDLDTFIEIRASPLHRTDNAQHFVCGVLTFLSFYDGACVWRWLPITRLSWKRWDLDGTHEALMTPRILT